MAAVQVSGVEAFLSEATESLNSGGAPAHPLAGFYTAGLAG